MNYSSAIMRYRLGKDGNFELGLAYLIKEKIKMKINIYSALFLAFFC